MTTASGSRRHQTLSAQSLAYVAVVCAPWRGARGFEDEKSRRDEFRTVRALNASDLEAWLECAPTTTVWLRDRLDKPRGVELLASWWDRWSARTAPPLSDKIVLAGRAREAEMLRDRCAQRRGGVCSVGGDMTASELTAFAAAALGTDSGGVGARALYTEDRSVLNQLINPGHVARAPAVAYPELNLIVMVPSLDCAADVPTDSPHLVIAASPGSPNAQIRVKPVDSEEVAERLQADGFELNEAHRLGSVARMSLPALCRQIARHPDLLEPDWCKDTLVRRMILLGGWHRDHEGDKQTLEQVTGRSYEELTGRLYAIVGDPPLVLTGPRWHTASPSDAWDQISHRVTHEELEDFRTAALQVLVSPDPYQSMDGAQELLARSQGVRAKHSETIQRGIATTLALLGAHPPQAPGDLSPRRSEAAWVVVPVLRQANEDATASTWVTLSKFLPLLAEAAPDALLAALRKCIAQQHPFAQHLLEGASSEMGWSFAPPELIDVRSALETLAWAPDYFAAAVSLLAQIVPPPASTGTSAAIHGLQSIFCPWLPQTFAGPEERLQALDRLREDHPQVSWIVMVDMLDTDHARAEHHGPRFRDWKPTRPQVSRMDLADMRASVAERLVGDAGSDRERLATLVRNMSDLPRRSLAGLRDALEAVARSDAPETTKVMLWSTLRAVHAHHSAYPHRDWSLDESDLAQFAQLLEAMRPTAPADRYGWLFAGALVHIPEVHVEDRAAHEQALRARHTEAVMDTLDSHGFAGVLELVSAAGQPLEVGRALARTGTDQIDAVIESLSGPAPPAEPVVSAAFGYLRETVTDWASFQALIASRDLSARTTADLLRAMPPAQRGWRRAAELGDDVERAYWERADPYSLGFPDDVSELLEVSQGLRAAGRFDYAASTLHMGLRSTGCPPHVAEEILACLQERAHALPRHEDAGSSLQEYRLSRLMQALDENRAHLGRETVATAELDNYPELRHAHDFKAPNLYWLISTSPAFFVSLVEAVFASEPEPAQDTPGHPETRHVPPETAWDILHDWPPGAFCPGTDGTLDAEELDAWVQDARAGLAEAGRVEVGDLRIGEALAAAPSDPSDDDAPSEAVRNLIERLNNDEVDAGYQTAVFNLLGATSRGLTEGGTIERGLAGKYRDISQRYRSWPRTAAIFDALSASYEGTGDEADQRAEAHRRGQSR